MSNDVLRPGSQRVAPMSVAGGKPTNPDVLQSYSRMLGMLRDIRAEVQNLRNTVTDVVEKSAMADVAVRSTEILTALKNNKEIYDYNATQVNTRLDELRTIIRETPELYDRYGDEFIHIENAWERATNDWPKSTADLPEDLSTPDEALMQRADEVLRAAEHVIEEMDTIIYHTGLLTIPGRLNQHLEQLRIGRALDFNNTFKDEVAKEEDRQRILQYIHARPIVVPNGVIDLANGLVFRAAASVSRRWRSYFYITLMAILGALMVYTMSELGNWMEIDDWPIDPNETTTLMIGYGFTLLGGLVHIGVDAIKQARDSTRGNILALEDWFLWGHINEAALMYGVGSLWVGFVGLMFINQDIGWELAFLVGYSIDSFVDIFLQRFSAFVSTRSGMIISA